MYVWMVRGRGWDPINKRAERIPFSLLYRYLLVNFTSSSFIFTSHLSLSIPYVDIPRVRYCVARMRILSLFVSPFSYISVRSLVGMHGIASTTSLYFNCTMIPSLVVTWSSLQCWSVVVLTLMEPFILILTIARHNPVGIRVLCVPSLKSISC